MQASPTPSTLSSSSLSSSTLSSSTLSPASININTSVSPSGSPSPSSPLVRKKRNFKPLGLAISPVAPSPGSSLSMPSAMLAGVGGAIVSREATITPDHPLPTPPLLSVPKPPMGGGISTLRPPPLGGGGGGRRRPPPLLDVSKSKALPKEPKENGVHVSPARSASSAGGSSPFGYSSYPGGTPNTGSQRTNLQNKLSEQLATLEMGEKGERIELKVEDLKTICELGQGNGGTVSKVMHIPTGKTMARKLVLIDAKPAVRKQILRELQIMHDCRSTRIISFYGAFVADPHICICMEFADKGSLDQIYKRIGAIDIEVVAQIALAVLEGLTYLYDAHRIIHRDIKPSNILFNSAGQIKLCDFGVSGELINSIADTFVGTSTYMSPERIQGAQYTVKSDVWSLGITLIELALGRFPFSDDDSELEESDEEDEDADADADADIAHYIANGLSSASSVDTERSFADSEDSFGEGTLSPRRAPLAIPPPTISISSASTHSAADTDTTTTPQTSRGAPKLSAATNVKKNRRKSRGVSLQGGGMTMSILELLQHIVNEPAPTLPAAKYGQEARDFVAKLLEKKPEDRPSPKELLGDRWMIRAREEGYDLVAWAETIP
ncbi:kinase-like protein [Dacryopinax primogenitus]|uniref:Kinase-like protein n=1 Tax=Dacryopinax primogenitus (strain DJM 731) TaxID=1858805 RepID=M5GBB0_DACPD|nr:kinase-like protein [Dacryopinax primogenitus]EJU03332.1 kinase-like protein [Dacryopinax primogenitus]